MSDLCDICGQADPTELLSLRDCSLCEKVKAHSLCILEHCRADNVTRWGDSWRCQACAGESSSSEVLSKPADLETLGQRVEQLGTFIQQLRGAISGQEQEISIVKEQASAGTFGVKMNIEEMVKKAVKEEVDKIREALVQALSDPELRKKYGVSNTGTGGQGGEMRGT